MFFLSKPALCFKLQTAAGNLKLLLLCANKYICTARSMDGSIKTNFNEISLWLHVTPLFVLNWHFLNYTNYTSIRNATDSWTYIWMLAMELILRTRATKLKFIKYIYPIQVVLPTKDADAECPHLFFWIIWTLEVTKQCRHVIASWNVTYRMKEKSSGNIFVISKIWTSAILLEIISLKHNKL